MTTDIVFTRRIIATKAGIIDHLREQMDDAQERSEDVSRANTRRDRDRAQGEVDGLDFALRVLEDWDETAAIPDTTDKDDTT